MTYNLECNHMKGNFRNELKLPRSDPRFEPSGRGILSYLIVCSRILLEFLPHSQQKTTHSNIVHHVSVQRRLAQIYRRGEFEYSLSKVNCRSKQIQGRPVGLCDDCRTTGLKFLDEGVA